MVLPFYSAIVTVLDANTLYSAIEVVGQGQRSADLLLPFYCCCRSIAAAVLWNGPCRVWLEAREISILGLES